MLLSINYSHIKHKYIILNIIHLCNFINYLGGKVKEDTRGHNSLIIQLSV